MAWRCDGKGKADMWFDFLRSTIKRRQKVLLLSLFKDLCGPMAHRWAHIVWPKSFEFGWAWMDASI